MVELWNPTINVWEDQENANYVRAERLLHGGHEPWGGIVGSSLVAEMRYFLDDDELFVLPQQGGSAREGLEVLVAAGIYPEIVYVELNALTVAYRADFTKDVTRGFRPFLAAHFKAFQLEYRPINLLLNVARENLGRGGPPPGAPRGDPWGDLPVPVLAVDDEAYQARLKGLQKNYQQSADTKNYRENLAAVSELLEHLARNEVRVVLIDLPIHPELFGTVYHQSRRQLAREYFAGKYDWWDMGSINEATVFPDAIHIPLIYTRELVVQLLEKRHTLN